MVKETRVLIQGEASNAFCPGKEKVFDQSMMPCLVISEGTGGKERESLGGFGDLRLPVSRTASTSSREGYVSVATTS